MKTFGITKPHPREVVSGDAWVVLEKPDCLRIALVDGSGHGEGAAHAATIAIESIRATADKPLADVLARVHAALHGSRGAAVSIAEIQADAIVFAGIGNVDGRLLGPGSDQRLLPQRGIAGIVMPRVRLERLALPPVEWALVLHSDGISQRFSLDWHELTQRTEECLAAAIDQWGRLTDDATLVAVVPS